VGPGFGLDDVEKRKYLTLWDVVYVYIETTTYRSDIQAFILVTCYTDVFTAGKR
jgi:hypothetical protein